MAPLIRSIQWLSQRIQWLQQGDFRLYCLYVVAALVDEGKVQTTLSETLQGLTVESIEAAHAKVLDGHMQGKVVVAF